MIKKMLITVVLFLSLILFSCTGDSENAGLEELPPSNTLYELDWRVEWNSNEKTPNFDEVVGPYFLPTEGPVDSFPKQEGMYAEFQAEETSSGGQLAFWALVKWRSGDFRVGSISLNISRGGGTGLLDCKTTFSVEAVSLVIRKDYAEGCYYMNAVGLHFFRWYSQGDHYLLQSNGLSLEDTLRYFATWEVH